MHRKTRAFNWLRSLRNKSSKSTLTRRNARLNSPVAVSTEILEERCLLTQIVPDQLVDGGLMLRELNEPIAFDSSAIAPRLNQPGNGIVINKGANLLANAAASAAADVAADMVNQLFDDPITVTVDMDLAALNPGVLGQAASIRLVDSYDTVRGLMVADASADEAIVNSLPTLANVSANLPDGFSISSNIIANKALFKALGVAGIDELVGATDATILFNSNFTFDFDPSDGIAPGQSDFVAVAAHEILHGMGFTSVIDDIDLLQFIGIPTAVALQPIDLFRFAPGDGAEDFTSNPRELRPGFDAVFYDGGVYDSSAFAGIFSGITTGDVPLSTGVRVGDGNQGSHWKADEITGINIGILDPSLSTGTLGVITDEDIRAMGLIRWDVSATAINTLDFGDAPGAAQSGFTSSYPTTLADDGARHISQGPTLGSLTDTESDGRPSVDAVGDNLASSNDEDGVVLADSYTVGQLSSLTVNLQNDTSAFLDAWVDFNRDGDWNDLGEQIAASTLISAGDNTISIAVPASAIPGETFARFRVSSAGGLTTTGEAPDGEVEDHRLRLIQNSQTVDDGDSSFTSTDGFSTANNQGFQGDVTFTAGVSGSATETARWSFDVVPGTYCVSTTWTEQSNRATNTPFTIIDGNNALATVNVNQEVAPNDRQISGSFF